MIVSETGPIIAFARIQRLDILRSVAEEIAVPEAVYRELIAVRPGLPGSKVTEEYPWLRRYQIKRSLVAPDLHDGEREAISLALELGVRVLLDEERGRRFARRRMVEVIGSLGILVVAKQQGVIPEVRPLVEALVATGYWISADVIEGLLRLVGE